MRVSVVICTYNRAKSLGDTLACLRLQNYDDFEVVVVNGPSTDDTEVVLQPWMDSIRYERCPLPNLSVSRNIGIRAAAGDVIAFIDDDALPEFDWLNQALPPFADPEVAGVGGIVFDHTGLSLQYKYSAANRFAETAHRPDKPFDDQCAPGAFQFPYLQGTNALFRRSALLRIGGFDETFDYYLDETDVCVRLIDAGYVLRQLADAPVHHKFLPSGVRDHHRVITNWSPIMKNQVYFSYRHALGPFTEYDIHEHSQYFLHQRVEDARSHEIAGRLPRDAANIAAIRCAEAFRVGMQLGLERHSLRLGPVDWPAPRFERFATIDRSARRRITFVTSGYTPNVTGGIARFFSDLAPALARRGHEIRVITAAIGPAAVDLEDGVWVHRIDAPGAGSTGVAPHVLPHINDFATAAVTEIERIGGWSSTDVVYGPLWDVEVLGVLERTSLPVAVQVATPIAIAADMTGALIADESADLMRSIMSLEQRVLDHADLFHANSSAVLHTIRENYSASLDWNRWGVVHLGLVDHEASSTTPTGTSVLFVGRFESRKGIDTYLSMVAELAPRLPNVTFIAAGEDRPLAAGLPNAGVAFRDANRDSAWIERVSFPGAVSDDELHRLYADASVVVLPSRYESFGLVMVEAMIHGKALVSCATSGVSEVVRDGVDGVLVSPGDVDALTLAVESLLDDEERRTQLGRRARQRFVDAFHIDRFAERFDVFLQRVCFFDASSAVSGDGSPYPTSRSVVGHRRARCTSGDVIRFSDVPHGRNRVGIAAHEDTMLTINGSAPVSLAKWRFHRIDLPDASGFELTVLDGDVTVDGIVHVRAESDR